MGAKKNAVFTEAEARKCWCPFSRVPGSLTRGPDNDTIWTGTQNRGYQMGGALDNTMCLASKCMAWRWHGTHVKSESPSPFEDLEWSADTYGYCGLAGSPSPTSPNRQ